jgi:hypothetical protein
VADPKSGATISPRRNGGATMAERVTLKAAVEMLAARGDAVSKSALSRYLKQHAEALPVEREGRDLFLDFELLARHRAENIRLADVTPKALTRPGVRPRSSTQAEGAARKVAAEAEIKEMQLAEAKGLLTPTAEVQEAAREAVTQMRAAFEMAVNTASEQIAARFGGEARLVRPLLKNMIRAGFEEFARAMSEVALTAREPPPS